MPYFGNDPTDTIIQNVAGGKVLQVVFAEVTGSSQISITTGSYTWTDNVSANITCSSSSNKVFITGVQNLCNEAGNKYCNGTFFRDTTNLADGSFGLGGGTVDVGGFHTCTWGASYLDSPNSTSQITYKMRGAIQSNGQGYVNVNDSHASLTLFEIEG